jgi:hypothetical protein
MGSMGRPLTPPELLISSIAVSVPLSCVSSMIDMNPVCEKRTPTRQGSVVLLGSFNLTSPSSSHRVPFLPVIQRDRRSPRVTPPATATIVAMRHKQQKPPFVFVSEAKGRLSCLNSKAATLLQSRQSSGYLA